MASKHRKKRLEQRYGKREKKVAKISLPPSEGHQQASTEKSTSKPSQGHFLERNYKALLVIPFLLLIVAFVLIGVQYAQTGDFINRGISLKGGTTITLTADMADLDAIELTSLESAIRDEYQGIDLTIRSQRRAQELVAISIETDITDRDQLDQLQETLTANIQGLSAADAGQNVQTSGSTLGESFFRQIIQALIVAFILMGVVVFIQFRVPVPSFAVILAAFSNIVVTLAVVNILGIKLSTAGIAAFLMLIGYSVDTDVLLSTRVLKNTEGTVHQRIMSAMKTGLTMNVTTLVAVGIALIFTASAVISQIMTILLIGLIVDVINTWIQNAGILRWYMSRRKTA